MDFKNDSAKSCCVVIGSSRGLGTALVDELIRKKYHLIVGVARTRLEDIPKHEQWVASKRYQHVVADVGREDSINILKSVCTKFSRNPLIVIFNAACLTQDISPDKRINYDVFKEVNRVGIDGLGHVIKAFENHLLLNGGIFVGISSVNALKPPIFEHRVAYGASKAYLNMALRNLSLAWPSKIQVATIYLGHVGGGHDHGYLPNWLKANYHTAAQKIISNISRKKVPGEITYPFIYKIIYQYILKLIPDSIYYKLLHLILK